jgi:hypothetical protein
MERFFVRHGPGSGLEAGPRELGFGDIGSGVGKHIVACGAIEWRAWDRSRQWTSHLKDSVFRSRRKTDGGLRLK